MPQFSCQNSDIVKIAKKILNQVKNSGVSNIIPLSSTEISNIGKALDIYNKDCMLCTNNGNEYDCFKIAEKKLMRSMPFLSKNIYPWKNYDWDYGNFIDNNYSVMSTGATKNGSISSMFKNMKAFVKLTNGYLFNPNPGNNSYAGKMAKDGDVSYYECKGQTIDSSGNIKYNPRMAEACRIKNKVKYSNPLPKPTTDEFLKRYPTTGDHSSSYYIKIGSCPRPDIKSSSKCEKQGYDWTKNILDNAMSSLSSSSRTETNSGSCSQPRYAYINNKPGFSYGGVEFQGLIPALTNDLMALSPDKILAALEGKNIQDLFAIQQCPNVSEHFSNNTHNSYKNVNYYSVSIICSIFIIIITLYLLNKNLK